MRFSAERAELEAVLNSGIFTRSPSLAQFLQYVCTRYFEGEADKIKEYNVAVEALGRSADFDQKKDSIVRVEAHRLRKRLNEYYSEEGADHALQIVVPAGTYVPQFVPKCVDVALGERVESLPQEANGATVHAPATLDVVSVAQPAITPVVVRPAPVWPRRLAFLAALAVIAIAAVILVKARTEPAVIPASPAELVAAPEGEEIRIAAGSSAPKLLDKYGNVWGADRYFEGGTVATSAARPIARAGEFSLYLTRREGKFGYHVPLKPGAYELRLHFAETVFGENNMLGGGESTRVFNIGINGKTVLWTFDVLADAPGSNTADVRVFKDVSPAADGKLHLEFDGVERTAFINGIEILPAHRGYMRPVRFVARDSSYTDRSNRLWAADRFVQGGVLIQRHQPIATTDDDVLYQSERYGNFTYAIPVAPNSHYTLTLRFCENWWGVKSMGGGGNRGERMFDVYCNGRALLRNFDVEKEAGGPLRSIDKVFKGLEPNAQGKLFLTFVPVRNYAFVNGIEVVDEGR